MMDRVERLLGKECYIIDYLPMTVEREGKGQFFEVEEYLLGSEGYRGIRRRFGAVVLMCGFSWGNGLTGRHRSLWSVRSGGLWRVRPLLERITWSEGLFWREGRTD